MGVDFLKDIAVIAGMGTGLTAVPRER